MNQRKATICDYICITIVLGLAALISNRSAAQTIEFAGYDINDAILSGHGNWSHTYNGNITPGVNFVNHTWPGTTATYNGVGSGTLNDGIFSNSTANTQLFIVPEASDGTPIDPWISLTLSFAKAIDRIEIHGGDVFDNAVPGAITAVTVEILDENFDLHSETFVTVPFGPDNGWGPINDRIDLRGSSLEGIRAFAVALFGFEGTVANWFSITEIELYPQLTAFCPDDGVLIEGTGQQNDFNAACDGDDIRWAAHGAAFAFQITDPVTQFQLSTTAPTDDPDWIRVDIEASKQNDNGNLNLRALLYNFATGQYVALPGTMPLTTADAIQTFELPAGSTAHDFVDPGTLEVRLLLQTIQTSGFANVRTQIDGVQFLLN